MAKDKIEINQIILLLVLPSGEGSEKVQRFKKWFWSTIEKMNPNERQDLVRRHSVVSIRNT